MHFRAHWVAGYSCLSHQLLAEHSTKFHGMYDCDAAVRLQFAEMVVAGDDQVRIARYGAFQDTVVCVVRDRVDGHFRRNEFGHPDKLFEDPNDLALS